MTAPQALIIAAVVGALAGAYASLWEMHKDSIYQGFSVGRFAGSVFVGVIVAIGLEAALQLALPEPAALTLLFGLVYAAERCIYDSWKSFARIEDRSDFFAPVTLSIGNAPVASRIARIAPGIVVMIAVSLFLVALVRLDRGASGRPTLAKSALAGLVAGLIVAARGAWKNAARDGFQARKFIRSPSMTIPFALLLSLLTQSYLCLAVAAIGYERAVVETWKVFCAHIASRLRNGPWA